MSSFSIVCTPEKHAFNDGQDLWCFDYKFEDGTEVKSEPLMPEATELMNRLLMIKFQTNVEKIMLLFSDNMENYDLALNYIRAQDGGSIYKAISTQTLLSKEVWLCPVFDKFFPVARPLELFVNVKKVK